ncbi:hypothetical protein F7734_28510 [Scytonema sp. UIC 10036]|nr:hypothetical protein [Scytonema sp. UIC 10036]
MKLKPQITIDSHFSDIDDPRIDRKKLHNRKDNAPQNLAIVRHIALNLLNQEKTVKAGVQRKRNLAGWDNKYLEKVLAGIERY